LEKRENNFHCKKKIKKIVKNQKAAIGSFWRLPLFVLSKRESALKFSTFQIPEYKQINEKIDEKTISRFVRVFAFLKLDFRR
jgi:hypothetical protein